MSSLSVIDSFLIAFWSPGPAEMMVLAVVALLLYGGNLPEVARSWGKTFAEFRRGLSGFQNEINDVIYSEPEQIAYRDDTSVDQGYEDQGYEELGYEEAIDESAEDTTVEDHEQDSPKQDGSEEKSSD